MIHIDSHWGNESDGYYDPSYESYDDENSYGYYTSNRTGEDRASYVVNKKCKYCGKTNLEWIKTARGWRLSDQYSGAIHNCLDKPLHPKANINPPRRSTSVYSLLSNAIQGNCLSLSESEEYDKLEKHCKEQGFTVEDILRMKK